MLKESQWIPDSRSLNCSNCQLRFTTIRRRHHCRRCGHCFCDSCCRSYPLIRMAFVDAVLQCYKCIEKSKYELDLFKFAFPCLEAGADLYVENYDCIFFAKLTANQRTVILTDPQNSLHTETIQVYMQELIVEKRSEVLHASSDFWPFCGPCCHSWFVLKSPLFYWDPLKASQALKISRGPLLSYLINGYLYSDNFLNFSTFSLITTC